MGAGSGLEMVSRTTSRHTGSAVSPLAACLVSFSKWLLYGPESPIGSSKDPPVAGIRLLLSSLAPDMGRGDTPLVFQYSVVPTSVWQLGKQHTAEV